MTGMPRHPLVTPSTESKRYITISVYVNKIEFDIIKEDLIRLYMLFQLNRS